MSAYRQAVARLRSSNVHVELSVFLLIVDAKLRQARQAFGPAEVGRPRNVLRLTMHYIWRQWRLFHDNYSRNHSGVSRTELGDDFEPDFDALVDLATEITNADTRTDDPIESQKLEQKLKKLNVARFKLCHDAAFIVNSQTAAPTVRAVLTAINRDIEALPVRSAKLNHSASKVTTTRDILDNTNRAQERVNQVEHLTECEILFQVWMFSATTDKMAAHAIAEDTIAQAVEWLCKRFESIVLQPETEQELAARRSVYSPVSRTQRMSTW